jgi:hypothetical protein
MVTVAQGQIATCCECGSAKSILAERAWREVGCYINGLHQKRATWVVSLAAMCAVVNCRFKQSLLERAVFCSFVYVDGRSYCTHQQHRCSCSQTFRYTRTHFIVIGSSSHTSQPVVNGSLPTNFFRHQKDTQLHLFWPLYKPLVEQSYLHYEQINYNWTTLAACNCLTLSLSITRP